MRILIPIVLLGLASCEKPKNPDQNQNQLPGGKGGSNHLVVFTRKSVGTIKSRVFLKFASTGKPSDTSKYDEAFWTMTEPGYGPHAHFNMLTTGFYYIHATAEYNGNTLEKDTAIELTKDSPVETEITLTLLQK